MMRTHVAAILWKKPKEGEKKRASHAKKPSQSKRAMLASLLSLVVGAGLLLYPVFATIINNNEHSRVVNAVMEKAQDTAPNILEEQIKQAREYNSRSSHGPIFDPFLETVVPDSEEYHEYLKLLNFDGVIGSVQIPKIKVKLPIYHGTSDETLGKGVGHLFGSSLPIGGSSTKAVLTAHSGLGNATMFDNLPRLTEGDSVYLTVAGETLKYDVIGTKVVLPTETDDLQIENGKDLIVLITCTPYGVNTHRLLVTAQRVPYDAETAQSELVAADSPWQTWMTFSVALVSLAVVLYIWRIVWRKKRRRRKEQKLPATELS